MMKCILSFSFIVIVGLSFSGCRVKKEQYTGVDGDFIDTVPLPHRIEEGGFFGINVRRGQYQPIYFSFDHFTLNKAEQDKVKDIAAAIKRLHSKVIIVAGFTDSWGTEEYNRALGERRASTVRQALIRFGVGADRVQTVSFGEEMPADSASNAAAWAKNRRVEIGIDFKS